MKINKAKQKYENIEIPENLSEKIEKVIVKEKYHKRNVIKPILATVGSFALLFVIMVNANPAFAKVAYDIPVIGNIAKVVTIKEYNEQNEEQILHVKMPNIVNTGNTKLEKKINKEIEEKIEKLVAESRQRVKEFKEMAEKQENEEFVFYPTEVEVNYEIKYSDENIVSFVIKKSESFCNYIEERFYYNIYLKTGEEITLKDMLGENYKEIATKQIEEQIENRKQTDPDATFFEKEGEIYLEHGAAFDEVAENHSYYMNKDKKAVVVFPKYTIAPGYMGVLEFEITK